MKTKFASFVRTPTRLLLLCGCGSLLITGCLSRPALKRENFALQDPPLTQTAPAAQNSVLQLRSVKVSPIFAVRALVYRTGPDSYELDPYAGFLISPERTLAIPIRTYLRNSGLFEDVVEPGSPIKADEFLEIQVSELYGDFRKSETPGAVLSLHAILIEAAKEGGSKIVLNRDYARRVPLKENTAAAVVAGYDEALAQIMHEFDTDLAAAREGK